MRLDMAQLNELPPAERDRYRALESLFDHPGWKIVMALAKQNADTCVQRGAFANSWADNRLAIGAGTAWNSIAKLEEDAEAGFLATIAEKKRAAEQVRLTDESDYE